MAETAMGVGVVVLTGLYLIVWVTRRADRVVRSITMHSFLIHSFVSLLLYSLLGLWAEDSHTYDSSARTVVDYWTGATDRAPDGGLGREGFIRLVAASYLLLGDSAKPVLVMNAVAIALAGYVTARTVAEYGGTVGAQRRAALIVLVLPSFAFWSSFMLLEALAIFLAAVCANGAAKAAHGRRWLLQTLVALGALFTVRGTAAILVAVALVPVLLISSGRRPGGLVVVGAIGAVLAGPVFARSRGLLGSVEDLEYRRTSLSNAGTGFSSGGITDPLSIPRIVAGPLPWEWSGALLVPMVDAIACWVVLYLTWRGVRAVGLAKSLALLLPAAALLLALAAVGSNYGLIIRLRAQGFIPLVPLAAIGLDMIRAQRKARPYRDSAGARPARRRRPRRRSRPARPANPNLAPHSALVSR